MDLLMSLVSLVWQQSTFSFLDASLHQLEHVALPKVALTSTPHLTATPARVHYLTKNIANFSEIIHGDIKKPFIALTFDDGFEPEDTIAMLDILKEKQVYSTFFLKGKWAQIHGDIVDRIIADGHELGNHSFNHANFTKISLATAAQEITEEEDVLIQKHNYSPKPYFRFPYGARTRPMQDLIKEHGYTSILWDIDTLDWLRNSTYVKNEVLTKAHNGAIVLMHLGKRSTNEALPLIIDGLREKGFNLVTVSELLNQDDTIPSS